MIVSLEQNGEMIIKDYSPSIMMKVDTIGETKRRVDEVYSINAIVAAVIHSNTTYVLLEFNDWDIAIDCKWETTDDDNNPFTSYTGIIWHMPDRDLRHHEDPIEFIEVFAIDEVETLIRYLFDYVKNSILEQSNSLIEKVNVLEKLCK